MNDRTDQQLLRDYSGNHSEPAFSELVRRHIDLVYSAALRMVGDADQAKDVTQGVFVALAQNAHRLADHPILSGWLHRTAQNLAANSVRANVRRQAREQEAAAMNELLSASAEAGWEDVASHLDAALGDLSETDRDAVMLRYFERKSAHAMGQALGISGEAAQKRVNRAVERLRDFLARRGVTVGAGGLVVLISAHAVQAAPAGLAVAISAAAVLAGAASTSTLAAQAAATTMNWINLKSVTAIVAAAVAAGAGTHFVQQHEASRLQLENQALVDRQTALTGELDAARADAAAASNRLATISEERSELLRLRGEVGMLRRQKQELDELRRRNDELQKSLAQTRESTSPESDEADPETREGMQRMNNARQLGLALLMFSADNTDHYPSDFSQVAEYLKAPAAQAMTNQFELVIHGSINTVTNPAETITVREKEPWLRNGTRVKVYGFVDGHAELKTEPPEGFAAWEKAHMTLPSAGQ